MHLHLFAIFSVHDMWSTSAFKYNMYLFDCTLQTCTCLLYWAKLLMCYILVSSSIVHQLLCSWSVCLKIKVLWNAVVLLDIGQLTQAMQLCRMRHLGVFAPPHLLCCASTCVACQCIQTSLSLSHTHTQSHTHTAYPMNVVQVCA